MTMVLKVLATGWNSTIIWNKLTKLIRAQSLCDNHYSLIPKRKWLMKLRFRILWGFSLMIKTLVGSILLFSRKRVWSNGAKLDLKLMQMQIKKPKRTKKSTKNFKTKTKKMMKCQMQVKSLKKRRSCRT